MQVLALVTADVAHYRWISAVHLIDMLLKIVLYFERLAAEFTRELVVVRMLPDKVILQGPLLVALIVADAALVHLRPVNFFHMNFELPFQSVSLRARFALVSVLLYVRYQRVFIEIRFLAHVASEFFYRPDRSGSVFSKQHRGRRDLIFPTPPPSSVLR